LRQPWGARAARLSKDQDLVQALLRLGVRGYHGSLAVQS